MEGRGTWVGGVGGLGGRKCVCEGVGWAEVCV